MIPVCSLGLYFGPKGPYRAHNCLLAGLTLQNSKKDKALNSELETTTCNPELLSHIHVRSDWPTEPSLPEKLYISQLYDEGNRVDRTDGPTMHFKSAPCKVTEIRQRTCAV